MRNQWLWLLAVFLGALFGLWAAQWHHSVKCNPLKPFTCEE